MKTSKIRISKKKIKALRRELIRRHELYGSWRIMARELYKDEINFSTLQKFVTKDFVPADERLLKVLGLITPPNPYRNLPRWYKRIPEALAFFNRKREQIREMSRETKRQTKNQ
jgi:hypothetical protein